MTFPYRVKRLRTTHSVSVGDERDTMLEKEHHLCIWRVSEREFRVETHRPNDMPLASQRIANGLVSCIDVAIVRDWMPYRIGEAMPHPEKKTPPEVVDGEERMLDALRGAVTKGAQPNKKPAIATAG